MHGRIFVQYANIDGFKPGAGLTEHGLPSVESRPELDRWLLSVLQTLIKDVNSEMAGYYLYKIVPPTLGFIDDLTNWYIRRSRRRFWRSADDLRVSLIKPARMRRSMRCWSPSVRLWRPFYRL